MRRQARQAGIRLIPLLGESNCVGVRVAATPGTQARAKHRPVPDRILMPNRCQPRHRPAPFRSHNLPTRLRHLIHQPQTLRPELRRRHRPRARRAAAIYRHVVPLQGLTTSRVTPRRPSSRPHIHCRPNPISARASPIPAKASSSPAVTPSRPADPRPPTTPKCPDPPSPTDAPPTPSPQQFGPPGLSVSPAGSPPGYQSPRSEEPRPDLRQANSFAGRQRQQEDPTAVSRAASTFPRTKWRTRRLRLPSRRRQLPHEPARRVCGHRTEARSRPAYPAGSKRLNPVLAGFRVPLDVNRRANITQNSDLIPIETERRAPPAPNWQ